MTPAKGYTEMKDSGIEWIPQIPTDWQVKRLKELFSFGKGLPITKADLVDSGVAVISYGQIHAKSNTGTHLAKSLLRYVPKTFLETNPSAILRKGDIVLADTSEDLDGLGNAALMDIDDTVFAGYHTIILHPGNADFSKYLSYLFRTDNWRSQLRANASGIKVFSVTQKMLRSCNLILPPKAVRDAITAYLDTQCAKIDEIIAQVKASIEDYKQWKASIIYEAVTKGLDPNVEMKDSGIPWIGKIPDTWAVCKTLYVLSMSITDGPHVTPELFDDGIPFISAEAVSCGNGKIDFSHKRGFISEEFYQECCKKYIPQLDDIFMIKSGATTGRVAMVDTNERFTIWSPLAVFRANRDRIVPRYLFYFLQSEAYQKQVELGWTYGTQQNIGMRTLETLKVCLPPLDTQAEIVEFLEKDCSIIDQLIAEKESLIDD